MRIGDTRDKPTDIGSRPRTRRLPMPFMNTAMRIIDTTIRLEDMRFHALHGVLEQERVVGGDYSVSLTLTVSDAGDAVLHDRLEATVNYATAYKLVRQTMRQPSALIEHVAGRILEAIFAAFPPVTEAEVKVCKLNPPMGADCAGASATVRAARE